MTEKQQPVLHDFGGPMLVAGTVTGVRKFDVTPDGKLTSLFGFLGQAWNPGDNTATCSLNPFPHTVASRNCTCGFYAYFAKQRSHYHGDVEGIIEAHGRVTMGSKGFRASHARIVALIRPDLQRAPRSLVEWLVRRQGVSGNFGASLFALAVVSSIAATVFSITLGVAVDPRFGFLAAWIPVGAYLMWAENRAFDIHLDRKYPLASGRARTLTDADWRLVQRNYPDVPVYGSLAEAVKHHPLSVRAES
jgi:hypothetical protein